MKMMTKTTTKTNVALSVLFGAILGLLVAEGCVIDYMLTH